MQQPYYTIDFSASACMFEIRVNDYPVIIMNIEGQVATTIPINYAILKSGEQTISVSILPLLGESRIDTKAELKFDIKLFDVTNDFVFKEMFGAYQSQKVEEDKILPVINYHSIFFADVPYELNAWEKGEKLKDVKDINKKLFKAYADMSDFIKSKNYDSFVKAIAKREENMVKSMYLSKEEALSRTNELLEDFENGFKIMPIDSTVILHICGHGKVASFKKPNGESALYLLNENTQEELMLDITFYIPEGKTEFEVI